MPASCTPADVAVQFSHSDTPRILPPSLSRPSLYTLTPNPVELKKSHDP